ncbi:hypothetical protein HMPREF0762_00499 [Slackia exigua ATCC 700122]|uniref:Uncharacterized protein n=1 Tax=Slackia exigua (strain ATCC 700122 / DSM 15923 / CIP 105133 / JCM 11022 / KCTC 5966 / S-7) TaxID=649764 RepID=D0WFI2_SLAES|nr:hypothetical protein HMPREF0762_00499 [Slackia exigua ATCC 700122]
MLLRHVRAPSVMRKRLRCIRCEPDVRSNDTTPPAEWMRRNALPHATHRMQTRNAQRPMAPDGYACARHIALEAYVRNA